MRRVKVLIHEAQAEAKTQMGEGQESRAPYRTQGTMNKSQLSAAADIYCFTPVHEATRQPESWPSRPPKYAKRYTL